MTIAGYDLGLLRETLIIQTKDVSSRAVSSLTRSGAVATVTMSTPHNYQSGDYLQLAGAGQAEYNVKAKITVTGTGTFTFPVAGSPASPATGTIAATFVSDSAGGKRFTFRTVDTVSAELLPLSAAERLQLQAIRSNTLYRFRIRARTDLTEGDRALWIPSIGGPSQVLEITGILPCEDGRTWYFLETARASV
jgi:head-tail adaptor